MSAKKKNGGSSKGEGERNYLLTSQQLEGLREEWKAEGGKKTRPPNPHRTGTYRAIVGALIELGANKAHPFGDVKREIKRQLSLAETRKDVNGESLTAWERFAGKESRNEETGKDVDGRIRQNLEVLQRVGDYGAKLIQVGKKILGTKGMTIDTLPDDMVRLSTDSDVPVRQLRRAPKGDTPKARKTKPAKANGAKQLKAKTAVKSKPKRAKGTKSPKADADAPPPQPFPETVVPEPTA